MFLHVMDPLCAICCKKSTSLFCFLYSLWKFVETLNAKVLEYKYNARPLHELQLMSELCRCIQRAKWLLVQNLFNAKNNSGWLMLPTS